jgi:hypothetical protein
VLLSALLLKLACKVAAPLTPSLSGACGVILTQLLVMLGAGIIVALGAFALGIAPSSLTVDSRSAQLVELSVTLVLCSAVLGRMLVFPFSRALLATLLQWLLWLVCIVVPTLIVSISAGISIAADAGI